MKTSRGGAVLIASLVVLAWATNEWPPNERRPLPVDDPRPHHAAAPRPPDPFAGAPHAALQRGDLGLVALLARALCREPMSLEAGGWVGGGWTAAEFQELYEADPGDAARFMFARRSPRADRTAP